LSLIPLFESEVVIASRSANLHLVSIENNYVLILPIGSPIFINYDSWEGA
jgi:hypothetical protein